MDGCVGRDRWAQRVSDALGRGWARSVWTVRWLPDATRIREPTPGPVVGGRPSPAPQRDPPARV